MHHGHMFVLPSPSTETFPELRLQICDDGFSVNPGGFLNSLLSSWSRIISPPHKGTPNPSVYHKRYHQTAERSFPNVFIFNKYFSLFSFFCLCPPQHTTVLPFIIIEMRTTHHRYPSRSWGLAAVCCFGVGYILWYEMFPLSESQSVCSDYRGKCRTWAKVLIFVPTLIYGRELWVGTRIQAAEILVKP